MNIVHIEEVTLINTIVTSKEAILTESRKIVMEQGISAINMRTVANACGVAVGSIYNYFPSKADLIRATVENVWKDIFHMTGNSFDFLHFTDCLLWFFERIKKGCIKYPEFFTLHSVSFTAEDKAEGRLMMEQYFDHIKQNLLNVLNNDSRVRLDAFNENLTPEIFIESTFAIFTSMLLKKQDNCSPLIEIVVRCIY